MPDVGFGGNVGSGFTGFAWVRSDGIGLPTGRAMANGGTGATITALGGYVAGNGGTRLISLQLGSFATGGFNVGNASHPVPFTGYIGGSNWAVNGGAASFYIYMNGASVNFGRSSTSGGSNTVGSSGTTWSGTLGGAYRYVEGPTAPSTPTVTPAANGTSATVSWGGVADNGGTAVTGYRVQRATNAAFSTGLTTVTTTAGSIVMTGLTPGVTYYFRVTARNYNTDVFSQLGGPWSGTRSAAMPDPSGLGRYYNGSTMVAADGRYYNGTTFVELAGKRYNGTTWEELGN